MVQAVARLGRDWRREASEEMEARTSCRAVRGVLGRREELEQAPEVERWVLVQPVEDEWWCCSAMMLS